MAKLVSKNSGAIQFGLSSTTAIQVYVLIDELLTNHKMSNFESTIKKVDKHKCLTVQNLQKRARQDSNLQPSDSKSTMPLISIVTTST